MGCQLTECLGGLILCLICGTFLLHLTCGRAKQDPSGPFYKGSNLAQTKEAGPPGLSCAIKSRMKCGIFTWILYLSPLLLNLWIRPLLSSAHSHVNHLSSIEYLKSRHTRLICPEFTWPTSFPFKIEDTRIRAANFPDLQ